MGLLEVTAQRKRFKFAVTCNLDADCMYLREDAYFIGISLNWLFLVCFLRRLYLGRRVACGIQFPYA